MERHLGARCSLLILAIVAFGAADALIKGEHSRAHNAIANISAPWLLIPFLSAAVLAPRRLALGALVGTLSTSAALVSYTVVRTLKGFQAGGHANGLISVLVSSLSNRWFLLGVVGGAALGAAGSRLALRRQWMVVALVVGSVLVMEPVARIIWALAREEPPRTLVPSPIVWTIEVVVGCTAVLAVVPRNMQRGKPPHAPIHAPRNTGPGR